VRRTVGWPRGALDGAVGGATRVLSAWLYPDGVTAARLAAARGLCTGRCAARIASLLTSCGLPVTAAPPPRADVAALVVRDKKTRGGIVRWVLPARLGRVRLDQPVDLDDALAALAG